MPRSSSAPPPRAGSKRRCPGSSGRRNPKSASTTSGSPMWPSPTTSTRERYAGRKRLQIASIRNRLRLRAASIIAAACRGLSAKGFSHRTCSSRHAGISVCPTRAVNAV